MNQELADIREVARAFVGSAFEALRESNVIPTPIYHPFVEVGRDYFGGDIRTGELESRLTEAYPDVFAKEDVRDKEFASTYVFSLLEACVARCGGRLQNFDASAPGVEESIEELLRVLAGDEEIVCCRFVSHLATADGAEAEIAGVSVVPESRTDDPRSWRMLSRRVISEIPGAASAFNRRDPRPYDPPHALLVVRERSAENPYQVADRLNRRLERFLLLTRLVTSGTVQTHYEVSGPTTLVSRMSPTFTTVHSDFLGMGRSLVRRTVRLRGNEGPAFEALDEVIRAADVERTGMVATSLDVALSKFHHSHVRDNHLEQIVDLATALEAMLSDQRDEHEGLTLRLRSRAAALLATADDTAPTIFRDVGHLYAFRSKLVHGGQISQKDLRAIVRRISTVPHDAVDHRFGIAIGYAVDRLRDLVRRSILARLCLAGEPDPVWPFAGSTSVDATLADDRQRCEWRDRWHETLRKLGVEPAAHPPRSAVDFLSPDDR